MTKVEYVAWARIFLSIIGTLWLGGYAAISPILALGLIGVWIYYACTYPLHRVTAMLVIAAVAQHVLVELMPVTY
jgi:hypothetical protein